jgi:hypothetical protein
MVVLNREEREKNMYVIRYMSNDEAVNAMTFESAPAALSWRMSMGRTFMGETWVDYKETV